MSDFIIHPTPEEREQQFKDTIKQIRAISLKDYVGRFLDQNAAQIRELQLKKEELDRTIAILTEEKTKMLELYRRVAKG